jgi:hypothetical protein
LEAQINEHLDGCLEGVSTTVWQGSLKWLSPGCAAA